MQNSNDHAVAAAIATLAGELLLKVRHEMADAEFTELKDAGDQRSHDFIMEQLRAVRPDDAILSEEGSDDLARLDFSRVWIVDPLDGTREFGEIPRSDWAVHVALAVDGIPTVGAVALPGLDLTLSTSPAPQMPEKHDGAPRIIASRSRPGPAAEAIAAALDGDLVFMGSAGAKAMAVVRGEADVYAHTGGQYEWDNCAPAAVAAACGMHTSRLDGSPLVYNNENPYLPDLLICRPEFADTALAAAAVL
ncbi:MAG: 3'(2'),5'-bisphosphate nucleotidase CysQ [Actinomycetia bacterium]|nr:3'(2'),5'-bisphosphate nucleotidase CysQ [Actinomycetes bacterium]